MDNNHSDQEEYEVEAIIGYRFRNGKDEYRVKWTGFGLKSATWEPVENLTGCQDKLNEFKSSQNKEIEEVFGCAQRGNVKYFLVKYKGMQEKTIIDWETAKNQPLIFIEFFGARLTWPPMLELIDPNDSILNDAEDDYEENVDHDPDGGSSGDEPNDIHWDI